MGKTRGVRYALRRRVRGLNAPVPVYAVDGQGVVRQEGRLHPLAQGQHWFEPESAEQGMGILYDGLPPYCVDMAPQGFLGRQFAIQHSDLDLPQRLDDWTDDHRLLALAWQGEDCVGNLIVGSDSLDRFLRWRVPVHGTSYPERANTATQEAAGSSAGGEQPKFTAHVDQGSVIVKFTPGDGSTADERWRDLLICESLGARHARAGAAVGAQCRWRDEGGRRFLESARFDRVGERGRRGILSLAAISDEWLGTRSNWTEAARLLQEQGLVDRQTALRMRWLDAFGRLIGNTDRHFGNLAFFCNEIRPRGTLNLAPVYDMLPMRYAPSVAGVPDLAAVTVPLKAEYLEVWDSAALAARNFWEEVEASPEISIAFRRFAGTMIRMIPAGHEVGPPSDEGTPSPA